MSNLTEEQIIKLIEENLDNKFKYHLDEMMQEKRPFGNSGFSQIAKDMIEISGTGKTWSVIDEDELSDLRYDYMKECFDEINEWIKKNRDNFKVKLFVKSKETVAEEEQ